MGSSLNKISNQLSGVSKRFGNKLTNTFARINFEPVIILGNQKTGTSAIAVLLSELTGLSVTVDLLKLPDSFVDDGINRTKKLFSNIISTSRLEFSRDIIKDPKLTFLYDELIEYFPKAKLAFVNRDPRDNLRSILDRLSIPGTPSQLGENELRRVSPAWRRMLDGSWLGQKGNSHIEIMAERWNMAADVYLQNTERMTLIRYEDFFRDKVAAIKGLASSLGLTAVNDISDKVDVQYQPLGQNRELPWLEFFGYENLKHIERLCGSQMKHFGYQASVIDL